MQANELRVGNWVQVKHTGHYVQIGHRDIGYIIEGSDNYSPIPLTPEILEQCGFVKTIIDRVVFWELEVGRTGKFQFYKGVMQFGVFGVANYEYHDVRPQYLHQLQNLYFSLTNTELTWNRKQ